MHLGNLKALSSALNAKDYYTLGHAARVAAYTVMLGRKLGWPEDLLAPLEEAAYLHDIGKISISDRVLLKPGRLNPQEWQQMRQHPVFSADIIRPLFPEALVVGVRHHHEHYDGDGYPDGLAGDDIPLLARAMAVVDAYDAMSCRRPYKAALTYPECLAELQRCRGHAVRPRHGRRVPRGARGPGARRAKAERDRRRGRGAHPRRDAPGAAQPRGRGHAGEYREIARDPARGARRQPADAVPHHARADRQEVRDRRRPGGARERDARTSATRSSPTTSCRWCSHGERPEVNTLFADEFGVWVTGLAPIRDADGPDRRRRRRRPAGPAGAESEALRGDGRQTFAAILQSAAVRLGRAEIDAITDALTGLYNHRYLHERLSEELHRAREIGRPLTVLFCDLDHFKDYNDANGHSAGDARAARGRAPHRAVGAQRRRRRRATAARSSWCCSWRPAARPRSRWPSASASASARPASPPTARRSP